MVKLLWLKAWFPHSVFSVIDIYPPHHTHAATSHAISAAFKNSINTSCRQTRTSFTKLCLRNWTPVWNDFLFSYKKRLFHFQIARLIGSFNISGRNFTAWIRGRHHGGRERTLPGCLEWFEASKYGLSVVVWELVRNVACQFLLQTLWIRSSTFIIFYFYFSLVLKFFFNLEYNCLTMLCQFLLYNNMNQLHEYTYLLPLGPPSHLPPLLVVTEQWAELPVLYSSFPRISTFNMIPRDSYTG